ncbi:hypothetical protein ACQP1W_45690 [Spirillospora sp. CA-255316]
MVPADVGEHMLHHMREPHEGLGRAEPAGRVHRHGTSRQGA